MRPSFLLLITCAVLLSRAFTAPATLHAQAPHPLTEQTDATLGSPSGGQSVNTVPEDIYWDDRLGLAGANGSIAAMVVRGKDIYVAGSFSTIGGIIAYGVARWDGQRWWPLGKGITGGVNAMVMMTNGDIIVGGSLTTAGGDSVQGIARWNGTAWRPLGTGVPPTAGYYSQILSMATDGTTLYVTGAFSTAGGVTVNNVASWDGTTWAPLGNGIASPATSIAVGNGKVYVAGTSIVMWDGGQWSTLGLFLPQPDQTYPQTYPSVMKVDGNSLYLAGAFTQINGLVANGIARYDGASWHAIGNGMPFFSPNANMVSALAIVDSDLYVGGSFSIIGDYIEANSLARWNGSYWSAVGRGVRMRYSQYVSAGRVQTMAYADGDLYVGGEFQMAGTTDASRLARWNPQNGWSTLRGGSNSTVYALATIGDSVWIGGDNSVAGSMVAAPLAVWWNSGQVNQYYSYYTGPGTGSIYAMTATPDYLYAAGHFGVGFSAAGNTNVLKWNGSLWTVLEDADKHGVDGPIYAVAADGGSVYVGGTFAVASGHNALNVAEWSGTHWRALGEGLNGVVRAIAVAGGKVYAGGDFTRSGETAVDHIAMWNGATWNALANGTDSTVLAIAALGNDLYVGGKFTSAGGVSSHGIARWSNGAWSGVDGGVSGSVGALLPYGTGIYAGGAFTTAGGVAANNIARWDGTHWTALGSGVDGPVDALAIGNGSLYVGGNFSQAGGKPSYNFAHWRNLIASAGDAAGGDRALTLSIEPNPIASSGAVIVDLAYPSDVTLGLFDPAGRLVAALADGRLEAGRHTVRFDAAALPSGLYFCRLRSGTAVRAIPVEVMR